MVRVTICGVVGQGFNSLLQPKSLNSLMVEHTTVNRVVVGSNPILGLIFLGL